MRFVIDSSLPRAAASVAQRYGHAAVDVRDIGMGTASDAVIGAFVQSEGTALLSADFDFADVRAYPPELYAGIVIVDRPEDATIAVVLQLIEQFFKKEEIVSKIAGHLVIIGQQRIRVRPPLV